MEEKFYDALVIGGGPAGLSAALYLARGNVKTAIIEQSIIGGQPVNYLEIENYLGFPSIKGYELSEKFENHLDKFNVDKFQNEEIQKIELDGNTKTVLTSDKIFKSKAIIIATGSSPMKLSIKGEDEFFGKGVSYCAVCDGAFYKDKTVVVIGGGNSALEEGIYLTKFAKKVYIMHRRDEFRADRIIQARAFSNEKIEFLFDSIPLEITGDKKVSKIKFKNLKTGKETILETDGVFPYIGLSPNTNLVNGQIEQDDKGFIITNEKMETSKSGVFAIGDVRKTPLRQVITAVSDGAVSGVFAVKYIEDIILKENTIRI